MTEGVSRADRAVFGIFASLAFVCFCAIAVWVVLRFGSAALDQLRFLDLVVLGLGCLRLIHLISYDKILEPLRERLEQNGNVLVAGFVNCLWCTGMWSAVVVVTAYALGMWGRLAVLLLAVASLGSLLQVISRAIAGCTPKDAS